MSWRMRCRVKKCQKRFTLKRHPDLYKRSPKCPECGSLCVSLVEGAKQRELERRRGRGDLCRCSAYSFPHRRGSLTACVHHPDRVAGLPLTEEEAAHWEATERTPRGTAIANVTPDVLLHGEPVVRTVRDADELPILA